MASSAGSNCQRNAWDACQPSSPAAAEQALTSLKIVASVSRAWPAAAYSAGVGFADCCCCCCSPILPGSSARPGVPRAVPPTGQAKKILLLPERSDCQPSRVPAVRAQQKVWSSGLRLSTSCRCSACAPLVRSRSQPQMSSGWTGPKVGTPAPCSRPEGHSKMTAGVGRPTGCKSCHMSSVHEFSMMERLRCLWTLSYTRQAALLLMGQRGQQAFFKQCVLGLSGRCTSLYHTSQHMNQQQRRDVGPTETPYTSG